MQLVDCRLHQLGGDLNADSVGLLFACIPPPRLKRSSRCAPIISLGLQHSSGV